MTVASPTGMEKAKSAFVYPSDTLPFRPTAKSVAIPPKNWTRLRSPRRSRAAVSPPRPRRLPSSLASRSMTASPSRLIGSVPRSTAPLPYRLPKIGAVARVGVLFGSGVKGM
jgi:hypothetical protein